MYYKAGSMIRSNRELGFKTRLIYEKKVHGRCDWKSLVEFTFKLCARNMFTNWFPSEGKIRCQYARYQSMDIMPLKLLLNKIH